MAVLCVESRPFLRIDLCLPQNGELNTEIRADFIQAVDYFKEIMTSLKRKEDFTEEDINLLQDKINLFADLWLGLHGDEGMANYTHYLVSGHVTYFLRKYRNLYKYSQQGWEYLNWRLKNYYFRRTQRAGKGSNGRTLHSIYPFLSRRLAWNSGMGDQLFVDGQVNHDESPDDDEDDEEAIDESPELYNLLAESTIE